MFWYLDFDFVNKENLESIDVFKEVILILCLVMSSYGRFLDLES